MSVPSKRAAHPPAASRPDFRFWRLAFLLWGTQWILAAVFGQLELFGAPELLTPATFWLAVAATLACLPLLRKSTASYPILIKPGGWRLAGLLALLLFSVALPFLIPAIYLADFYRSIALAAFYFLLGGPGSHRFAKLGVWLIALMAAALLFYLGFAPFLLGVLGGCSLIACAVIIL